MNITSRAAARGYGSCLAAAPAVRAAAAVLAAVAVLGSLGACGISDTTDPTPRVTPTVPTSAPPTATSTVPPTPVVDVPQVNADISNQPAPSTPPTALRVDELGIDMPVTPTGLASDGTMALDPNPAIAAWYRYGPAPSGEQGATVIAAHVDSLIYDLGPFAALANARAGQQVIVTTADGLQHRYVIESVQLIDKVAVPWDQVFDRTGPARLILVTCGGRFDYNTRHYLGSVIVTATPVG
jgi:hypothetical protein